MKKIFGNHQLISTLGIMVQNDRAPHSVIFHGERGCGKRLAAKYYTMLLMCLSLKDGKPCGECPACRLVEKDIHPDAVKMLTSGKTGIYSVKEADYVTKDAFIKPNNESRRKVYIFADCRNMQEQTQNKMLKIIEEPPDYAYFIFTSESRYEFLPTIISRCACFGISPCTDDEARESLLLSGYGAEDVDSAVSCFHGNIGKCTEYLENPEVRKRTDLTKRIINGIINKDEYELNCGFFSVGSDRSAIMDVLTMTDRLIRDAAALIKDHDAPLTGCMSRGDISALSEKLTVWQASLIHKYIGRAWSAVRRNVNAPLVLAALCAEISGAVS